MTSTARLRHQAEKLNYARTTWTPICDPSFTLVERPKRLCVSLRFSDERNQ